MDNASVAFSIRKEVEHLKSIHPGLTDYEALRIVAEFQRNEILKDAFVTRSVDTAPTALEAIALALGFEHKR